MVTAKKAEENSSNCSGSREGERADEEERRNDEEGRKDSSGSGKDDGIDSDLSERTAFAIVPTKSEEESECGEEILDGTAGLITIAREGA